MTPSVAWVLDPGQNPAAAGDRVSLPGALSAPDGLATHLGAEVLRTLVYGNMPDVVRRRLSQPWANRDRAAFTVLCGTLRALGPAIQRGLLADAHPEGTPHLRPGSATDIVLAGPSSRQRAAARAA